VAKDGQEAVVSMVTIRRRERDVGDARLSSVYRCKAPPCSTKKPTYFPPTLSRAGNQPPPILNLDSITGEIGDVSRDYHGNWAAGQSPFFFFFSAETPEHAKVVFFRNPPNLTPHELESARTSSPIRFHKEKAFKF